MPFRRRRSSDRFPAAFRRLAPDSFVVQDPGTWRVLSVGVSPDDPNLAFVATDIQKLITPTTLLTIYGELEFNGLAAGITAMSVYGNIIVITTTTSCIPETPWAQPAGPMTDDLGRQRAASSGMIVEFPFVTPP